MKVTIELRGQKSALNTEPVYLRFNHYDSKLFKGQLRFRYKTSYKIEKGADILKSLPNPIRHNLENCIKEVESDFNNRIDFVPTESWFIKTCSDFLNSKNEYLGGSISPGIDLRYQALHNYTDKLPLLKPKIIKKTWKRKFTNNISTLIRIRHLGTCKNTASASHSW